MTARTRRRWFPVHPKLSERHRERMRRRPTDLDEFYSFELPSAAPVFSDRSLINARNAVAYIEASIAAMDERAARRRAVLWPPSSWPIPVQIGAVIAIALLGVALFA